MGRWSIVATQNGEPIFMSPPTDEVYDRDLIEKTSEKLVTDVIQQRIKSLLKNGR